MSDNNSGNDARALVARDEPETDTSEEGSRRRSSRGIRAERSAFAKRLGQLVHGRGIRQAELARRSELAPYLISTYMLGKAVPGRVNVIKLAKALNVAPDTLMPEASNEPDPFADGSPIALVVSRTDPSMATLRINTQVRTDLGAEIIRMILKSEVTA